MKEVNSRNFSMVLQSRPFNLKPEIVNRLSIMLIGSQLRKDTVVMSGGHTGDVSPSSLCSQAEHRVAPHAGVAMWQALVGHWESSCTHPKPPQ